MLEAKRTLLLAISHELRSPLTRARVNAELLPDSPEQAALVRDLAAMRDLITDLLESERLASGHTALHAEPTDLAALVRDLVQTQYAAQRLLLDLADGLAPMPLDPARIRLLLRNLIENALRHGAGALTPPEVVLRAENPGQVLLSVRDHGPGVPPEHLPHLAEAFYRPDSARTRATGGVGLGLHLCRQVAQAHGGSLVLRNALVPVATSLGLVFGFLFGGTILVEVTFALNGVGGLLASSVTFKDIPVVQAVTLLTATVIALTALAVDLLYYAIDPRIRRRGLR